MALWHLEGSLDETDTVRKIPITHFPFIIGRSKSIDMVVLRSGISREHAEIFDRDGRLFIRDLQSTNGTFVNKQRISNEALLTHNSVIHLAQFDFKLVDSEYKASADEMLTVVMSLDDAPGFLDNASKAQNNESTKRTAENSLPPQKPSKKPVRASSVLNAVSGDEPSLLASRAEAPAQNAQARPMHHGDDKIFVQGQWDESNRRMHSRREVRWPALVTLKNQQSIQCTTKELSALGLALKSPVNIPERTLIKVNINAFFKGRHLEIAAIGVVKHSLITTGGFTVGIQIRNCTNTSSEFIAKFANREI